MVENRVILHAYWLSSCSWRVRAMLHAKSIPFEERPVDIVKTGKQLTEEYRAINPAQKVPALEIDGVTLVESTAIIQYIEDTRPEPKLMPDTALQRARMREICETIVSGIQPLQNFGLKKHLGTEEKFLSFTKYWTERGLQTLNDLLAKTSGAYCIGDQITLADICLVPQIYNGVSRHKLDLKTYPIVSKVYENLLKEELYQATHPKATKEKLKINL
uniref:maleylacetoacetate isomerase n=1 Tax=Bombyx mori TaxID=7091 RepID=A5HSJ9_BOMMO|nr:glutathione S-transferae zeta 2 [Bombyx mori]